MDKISKEESLNCTVGDNLGNNNINQSSYDSFEHEPDFDENCCLLEEGYNVKNTETPNRIPWKIYVSRALSAWGDRIWDFGVGIFMIKLDPDNLRLVAIQGCVISISVTLFGAAIGNWIDRNKRLLAAKVLLAIQNVSVAVACIILVVHFWLLDEKVTLILDTSPIFFTYKEI